MDAACAIHFTSFAVEIERAPGPGWKYPGNKKLATRVASWIAPWMCFCLLQLDDLKSRIVIHTRLA